MFHKGEDVEEESWVAVEATKSSLTLTRARRLRTPKAVCCRRGNLMQPAPFHAPVCMKCVGGCRLFCFLPNTNMSPYFSPINTNGREIGNVISGVGMVLRCLFELAKGMRYLWVSYSQSHCVSPQHYFPINSIYG